MASTGAVFYVHPMGTVSVSANRATDALVFFAVRAATGLFTNVGVIPSRDLQNLRSFLPHSRQQVLNPDGTMNPAWYRFFQMFVGVFLGGAGAYTLQDILDSVATTQEQITAQAIANAGVATQSQANAEALQATVQVVNDSALPGAEQIPPVVMYQAVP